MQGRIVAAILAFKGAEIVAKTGIYVSKGAIAVSGAALSCTNKSNKYMRRCVDTTRGLENEHRKDLEEKVNSGSAAGSAENSTETKLIEINPTASSSSPEKKFDPKSPTPIRMKKRAKSDEEGGSSQVLFLKPPGNAELISAYKSLGLVGEEQNALMQTFAAVHGMSFGIEGSSGSGKSHIINLLIELLPRDAVYTMELSSKTAEMYNCDEINQAKIIYIPELQKAIKGNPVALEIIKNLTEGRDAVRRVKAGSITLEQRIEGGKSVVYTLAAENLTKKDAELTRRFFTLYTDSSEEQTARIMEYLALGQYRTRTIEEKNTITNVRKHIETCMGISADFVNPFAAYSVANIPKTVEMRSKVKHYLKLLSASARFNYHSRHRNENELYVSMEDVFNVNNFCNSSLLKGCFDNFNYKECFISGSNCMLFYRMGELHDWWLAKQFNKEHQVSVRDFITGNQVVLVSDDDKIIAADFNCRSNLLKPA